VKSLDLRRQIEELIRKAKRSGEDEPLPTPLLLFGEGGALDSVAALRLMMAIESAFGIVIEDDEITTEHFHDLDTLVAFVKTKLAAPQTR
jgi:acyl carrier protein